MNKRLWLNLLIAAVFLILLVAGTITLWAVKTYPQAGSLPQETLIYIPSGTSARGVFDILLENNVIDETGKYVFLGAVRLNKINLQAGEYQIPAAASIKDAIMLLQSGKVYQRKITLPEGLTSAEIVNLLEQAPALEGAIAQTPPEGTLLPETYNYARGETRQGLILRMQTAMTAEIEKNWADRDTGLPFQSPQEMVSLASIIEKETGIAAERPRVAGVFINRLRQSIPLQSDPTVIYALTQGKTPLGRALLLKDLEISSPYNTYKIQGIPPGPIANPGKESLAAAAHPEKHDWIFFVADGSGGHAFAKTLKEHNKNVSQWRKIRH